VSEVTGILSTSLTVDGFEDTNGNAVDATLVPEPATLGTFGSALLIGAGMETKAVWVPSVPRQ
jgi:hypothetical protein